MNVIKYLKHLCYRQFLLKCLYPHKTYYLLFKIILIFLFLSAFLLSYYCILVIYLNYCCFSSSDIIISLTTTPKRFQYELPITIHSLLTQIKLPKEIRIYLSPTSTVIQDKNVTLEHLKLYVKHVDSSRIISHLFDKLVHIYFEEQDYGPATKFLPILKEFHSLEATSAKFQPILICDDDHYYHPYTISSLETYSSEYKNNILGFRGWRIRDDLHWGVGGDQELAFHIIESYRLSEVYRVGILTANHAYLIRPLFFSPHIYLDFNNVSSDIRHVDDIWLNGYASKRNISRLVIPSCCSSISVTRTHEIENYFLSNQMTRASANDHALEWFKTTWEKDLWYKFHGQNSPTYSTLFVKIYREWIKIILRLKFIIYCQFFR